LANTRNSSASDLSARELEIDVNRPCCAKTFRLEDKSARRIRGVWRKQVPGVAAHHQADKAVGIKPGEPAIGGDRSVLQNGHVVAKVEDLVQPVGNVEDRYAPIAQTANKLHQDGDVWRSQ
jgi:hypothetical protein